MDGCRRFLAMFPNGTRGGEIGKENKKRNSHVRYFTIRRVPIFLVRLGLRLGSSLPVVKQMMN